MPSTALRLPLALTAIASLAACGGGGGDAGTPVLPQDPPTVSGATVSASSVMYGHDAVVTVQGTHLGNDLSVTSSGCKSIARGTVAPYASTDTTAYYLCRTGAVGAQTVAIGRVSTGASLATVSFTVPMPQVSMTITNNAGVNGDLVIALAADKTPLTVDNFLYYVNSGFYDHTAFHRLENDTSLGVLQGGGYAAPVDPAASSPPLKATNAPVPLEVNKGLSNTQWTIAMARQADPNTATSQFFFNLRDNHAALDPSSSSAGYAVFGNVASGTDVLQAAMQAPCQTAAFLPSSLGCLPVPNIVITSALQTQ